MALLHSSLLPNASPCRVQPVSRALVLVSASSAQQACPALLGLQLFVLLLGNCPQAENGGSRGARLVSYAAVLELQSYTVCRLLSKTAASCILLSFIVVYWKGLVQYQLFIMDGHFLQSLFFFFSRLFSVWTGISLGDTGGQNEE